jgi:hypothetical protein
MRAAVLVALALTAGLAAPPDPVSWKVQSAPAQPVKPGVSFSVKLLAAIQPGWHVYSMRPIDDGPIPTRVWLAEGQPFQLSGPVKAQDPASVEDPTLQKEVELYEGDAWFDLPVKASSSAAGPQKMSISVSYQSCNNKMCLPPKTVHVEVPVTIAK